MGLISSAARGVGKAAGRIVDVRVDRWMSYDYVKGTTQRTMDVVRDTFTPEYAEFQETFEEALVRMNLTEQDLADRVREFTFMCRFNLLLTLLVLSYTVYMALFGSFIASLIALCLSFWCAVQAFRYHFWVFQIRQRRLGCTFKEWFDAEMK